MRNLDDNLHIPPVSVLTGCTASGKTGVLLKLKEKRDIEVISADSRQVYRGLDIGTAKPSLEEQSVLAHHLIDIINPDEAFSAGMFSREAQRLISEIRNRDSIPVIAGGTVLYLLALTGSLDPMPRRCSGVREGLMVLERETPGVLYRMLEKLDPLTAASTGEGDIRRQIRALELFALTGSLPAVLRKGGDPKLRRMFRIVGISLPREDHRRKIRSRAADMIDQGLVDEVKSLLSEGWGRESVLGRTIGYREVLDFLDGSIASIEKTIDAISASTWHLVRKQKNMFDRFEGIVWVEDNQDLIEELLLGEGGF
ncbi:MAG: tRNA (adenosine(37)-N6)-dimethylallyltransferase MiaA [Candidatus Aegiribacteria sp.]|nr:tRNA (adenosine(37)-N6)-dimethylallyltransferase MiaA [Candidatus Aegiribacteria sp.]